MSDSKLKSSAVQHLKSFTCAHGTSGFEGEVSSQLEGHLTSWGEKHQDRNGSVAFSKGLGPHVMIAAHMDEVGFRVQSVAKNGFIKFVPIGGWWAHTLLSQRVTILTKTGQKISGVIGSKPVHFLPVSTRDKVQKMEDLYIDIGVDSSETISELGIQLGDPIVPHSEFTPLSQEGRYMAKAFDNRVGCAAIAQIPELIPNGIDGVRLSLAATVQEEIGLRGAKTLANTLKPDFAIILEGSPADDTPGFNHADSQAILGNGVQIRLHDPSAIMSPYLTDLAIETANKAGIKHQLAVRTSGGTDAGAFSYANEGIPSIVLGVPSRYIHTHNAIIELEDHLAMLQLAIRLATSLKE